MTDRRLITDRTLKAMKPAPKGKRIEIWDSREPGFGVRVSDREDPDPQRHGKAGKITFVLYARFTTGAPATRRVIGDYPGVSLEQARDTEAPGGQGHRSGDSRGRKQGRSSSR